MKYPPPATPEGSRVRIQLHEGGTVTDVECTLVGDYGDEIAALRNDVGRQWARPQRYGIVLDDGRLVFTDVVARID
ncbi:hypothetical protein LRS71_25645 [Rhodococcus pyridinivorans]|uniref:hypothetical protein n=1 Tax=Rhodococcus pyridinivorans TaxID=103816 RepID=UPI001E395CA7|nr:hypothetical protein [Rhodococcus pyridinivorans]MCD5422890.1 hypothetical protein [Rhodococcus pyridinivorans]